MLLFSRSVVADSLLSPVDWSMPGFPVLPYLPELQAHVHWVSDVIHSSHHLLPPSPLGLNLSQHQGLLQKTLLIYCPHFSYVHFFLTMWGSWVIRCTPWGRVLSQESRSATIPGAWRKVHFLSGCSLAHKTVSLKQKPLLPDAGDMVNNKDECKRNISP